MRIQPFPPLWLMEEGAMLGRYVTIVYTVSVGIVLHCTTQPESSSSHSSTLHFCPRSQTDKPEASFNSLRSVYTTSHLHLHL
jgi:hypothetical protein